ncbi:hypothetical protein BDY19DRAFT_902494 [Irpex rosettiformis]|uniref:Uncharacterized protein n=1 Tax=Irpex rosettiformis TaxID=378272 RepID=A0ACB8UHI2_9APHY|nr:hypothetical protein BDY19DRAFT_902494 [Irpex rosettiformis]
MWIREHLFESQSGLRDLDGTSTRDDKCFRCRTPAMNRRLWNTERSDDQAAWNWAAHCRHSMSLHKNVVTIAKAYLILSVAGVVTLLLCDEDQIYWRNHEGVETADKGLQRNPGLYQSPIDCLYERDLRTSRKEKYAHPMLDWFFAKVEAFFKCGRISFNEVFIVTKEQFGGTRTEDYLARTLTASSTPGNSDSAMYGYEVYHRAFALQQCSQALSTPSETDLLMSNEISRAALSVVYAPRVNPLMAAPSAYAVNCKTFYSGGQGMR